MENQPTLNDLTLEQLKELCVAKEIQFHPATKEKKLIALIEAHNKVLGDLAEEAIGSEFDEIPAEKPIDFVEATPRPQFKPVEKSTEKSVELERHDERKVELNETHIYMGREVSTGKHLYKRK